MIQPDRPEPSRIHPEHAGEVNPEFQTVARMRDEIDHLRAAVETNRVIGEAVGLMMARHNLTHDRALSMLRGVSQATNIKLVATAADLIAEHDRVGAAGVPPVAQPGPPARAAAARRLDQQTVDILTLLAAGHTDDTVAHRMSMSLRSVRRRVADYMAGEGARSRFQAGMALHRSGLLESSDPWQDSSVTS